MPSPPRPLRGSPPRRALHERTESQTNERSLRMVGDPQAPIYGSPFPTKPSQILSPRGQGLNIEAEPGVSHGRNPLHGTKQFAEAASHHMTSQRNEGDTESKRSDYTSSKRLSTAGASLSNRPMNTPCPNTSTSFFAMDQPADDGGRVSDDIVQLPSVPLKKASPGACMADLPNTLEHLPVQSKDSESSLSSTNSTGTVIVKKNHDGKKRASYSAFPNITRPSSSRSTSSTSAPQKAITNKLSGQSAPISPISPSSPVSPPQAGSAERRNYPFPAYANLQIASQSSVNLQYPVIRPPSASASWVEPPDSTLRRPERMTERNHERWNPHLSTVQSEGTGSQSEERSSQTMWLPDSSRVSKSSSMVFNGRGSSDLPATSSPPLLQGSPDTPSQPSSPPVHRRNFTGSTIRVVTEPEDTVPKLRPIPGSRDSEHLGVPSASEKNQNTVIPRPSSRASFFRDSIPAWARLYYSRPQSSSSNIFRPKNRHNQGTDGAGRRSSLAIGPVPSREPELAEVRDPPRREVSPRWSPHLWHDRTSLGRRRTIFHAPSIDGQAEGKAPKKRYAQILLFVVGFILPPAWFLASFLPLPPRPEISSVKGQNNGRQAQVVEDIEKRLGPIDEARYENARWWRNINRIMSLIGIVIVVAVITIAAVTAK